MLKIAGVITLNFRSPIVSIGVRDSQMLWAAMPKAPVDENGLPSARERQVGFAGKVAGVKAVAVSISVKQPPNNHFRFGIA